MYRSLILMFDLAIEPRNVNQPSLPPCVTLRLISIDGDGEGMRTRNHQEEGDEGGFICNMYPNDMVVERSFGVAALVVGVMLFDPVFRDGSRAVFIRDSATKPGWQLAVDCSDRTS